MYHNTNPNKLEGCQTAVNVKTPSPDKVSTVLQAGTDGRTVKGMASLQVSVTTKGTSYLTLNRDLRNTPT